MRNPIVSVVRFYVDGFRQMKLGKTLWLVVLIKLFILFFVLRVFFFPNYLNSRFDSGQQKAGYVGKQLTERSVKP
jgi:hypothetical protein